MLIKWKESARKLKRETMALWLALKDKRTPWYARMVTGLVVAYAFSPIDLIPDFIPILGYLDDLILVPLGAALAIRLIPKDVMAECREQTKTLDEKPVSWSAAAGIIAVWLTLAALAIEWAVRFFRR